MDSKSDFVLRVKELIRMIYPTEEALVTLTAVFVEYDQRIKLSRATWPFRSMRRPIEKAARRYLEDKLIELACAPDPPAADDGHVVGDLEQPGER